MSKEYKITNVQIRDPWEGKYGKFNAYALQLQGFDGWVKINQVQQNKDGSAKAAPNVGEIIFGDIVSETKGDKTYFSFKKQNPNYGGDKQNSGGSSINQKDIDYIVMMLEELTLRRQSPDEPQARQVADILPTEEEVDNNKTDFDLAEIPF